MKIEDLHTRLTEGCILGPKVSREKWLAYRSNILGGSEIGVVTGQNPFKKPLQLKLEKRGEIEREDPNYLMRVGSHMESFIRDDFKKEREDWAFGGELGMIRHKDNPQFAASVDDWGLDEVGDSIIIDYKNVSSYGYKKWKDGGLPDYYYAQGQWYMEVLGSWFEPGEQFQSCYFRALVDNRSTEMRVIQRDEQWISNAITMAKEFWQAMLDDDVEYFLNDIDGDKATAAAIASAYPGIANSETLEFCDIDTQQRINEWCASYQRAREMQDEIDKNVRRLKSSIQSMLQNSTKAITDTYRISWPVMNGRAKFDKEALQKAHPEIKFDDFNKPGKGYRGGLRITPVKTGA
jgi:putative phage-type endonuclease